jgi:acyl carrier protein
VRVARADVAEASALAAALAETEPASPPLRGVVHAAGTLDDGIVMQLRPAQLASVMRPKVDGAWNLHEATAGRPLDFFVLFSSAASVLGSPGQAIYAAANAFLDALVHERRARGLPGLSINWGPWSGVGLAARPDRGGRLSAGGIGSLTPAQGQAALASLLQTDTAQVTVMPVDWRALARLSPSLARAPFLAPLVAAEAGAPTEPGAEPPRQTVAALRAAAPAARQGLLEVYLQEQVARVLRLPPAKLDVHRPLSTLGIDSLMAVELKNRVESELRTSLPLIRLVQGPSVAELAGLLLEQMEGSEPPPTRVERPPAPPAGPRDSLLLSILSLGEDERNA